MNMATPDRDIKVTLRVDTTEYRQAIARMRAELGQSWELELALALGYIPESFDEGGMYRLTAHPFTIGPDHVIAENVVCDENGRALIDPADDTKVRTFYVRHPLPEGWTVAPLYQAIPPSE